MNKGESDCHKIQFWNILPRHDQGGIAKIPPTPEKFFWKMPP